MVSLSVNQYLSEVYDALQCGNGPKTGALLSFRHYHITSPMLIRINDPVSAVERIIDPPWSEIIIGHIQCIAAVNNGDYLEAYRYQSSVMQFFNKIFQSHKDDNWALPVLYTLSLDIRLFAQNADISKRGVDKPFDTLEKAAELLISCFRICASDNRSSIADTKRIGMLYLVNQLFKIYFKINKLHLCKPLIRAIESSNLKDNFSKAQLVTYRYFVGQKAMFDNDIKTAEEHLSYAFERCHINNKKNKRLILIYLIPVKMLLGHMPNEALLIKYNLLQFRNVVKAIKEGNLLQFKNALEENEHFFIKCGIYLILEKLKIITYRNLFKKVYLLLGTHQIPIEAFLIALKMMEIDDIDADEVACIMANLIFEGKVKGYISHQHQKVVVSKQNAFPPLSSIAI